MSVISKNELRFPYSRQPAHCVIVDLTSHFSSEHIQEVAVGISNFFALVCSMNSGPSRIPSFAMLVMTPYTEVVLPLQRIMKSSFTRVDSALSDMQKLLNDGTVRTQSKLDIKSLEHCIRDATSQFSKIKQSVGSIAKLELTILMCRNAEAMQSAIVEALSKVNITDINHVNGISLVTGCGNDVDIINASQEEIENSNHATAKENGVDLNGILEVSRLDCDSMSIESMMRHWLSDRSIDREHLLIKFNKLNGEKQLLLKCDVRERLIDTYDLPLQQCFEICTDNGESVKISSQTGKSGIKPGSPAPIVVLRVTKKVLASSICESIVFGKPVLLSSSNCWQMEWDELETNQNHFNALCKCLVSNKEALICENVTPVPGRRGHVQTRRPRGLFVLMASKSSETLLLKSISCRELLLSSQVPVQLQWDIVPSSAMEDIDRVLSSVESEPEFNPMLSRSGLIQSLKVLLRESSADRREPLKKFPQNSLAAPSKGPKNVSLASARSSDFQLANMKPATGKAARFIAPRQNATQVQAGPPLNEKENGPSDVPTICLGLKQRQGKTVTFPDFTDF